MPCEYCDPKNQKDLIYEFQHTEFPNHPNQLWGWIDWEEGIPYLYCESDWRWSSLVARQKIGFCPMCGRKFEKGASDGYKEEN